MGFSSDCFNCLSEGGKQNYVCESYRWIRSLGFKKREKAQEQFKRSGEWRMDSSLWAMGYSLGSGQVHTAQLIRMLTFSQEYGDAVLGVAKEWI